MDMESGILIPIFERLKDSTLRILCISFISSTQMRLAFIVEICVRFVYTS